jgi:hypothetical protein
MAEIFQIQAKDVVLRLNQFDAINAVQNFDWNGQFNEEQLEELGNENYSAQPNMPEVKGSMEVKATGSTVALLRRMITKFDGTGKFVGYLSGQHTTDVGYGTNAGTIRGRDLERAVFDVVEAKKANEVFFESTVLPRMHLTQLQFSADANGMAGETYSFEGDLVRLYEAPRHDVQMLPAIYATTTTANVPVGYTLALPTGSPGASTYVIRHVMVGDIVYPASTITALVAGTGGNGDTITFGGGVTITPDQRISVCVYKKTPGAFPTIKNPTSARFVKADSVDVFLVERTNENAAGDNGLSLLADGALLSHATLTSANRLLRVQTGNMNIDLRREALKQLAKTNTGNSVYYRAAKYPLAITSQLSLLETDWTLWAKLTGVDTSVEATGALSFAEFETKTWQIVFRYYYQGTPVQVMAMCNARVTAPGHKVGTGSRAERTWDFQGSDWVVEGVAF